MGLLSNFMFWRRRRIVVTIALFFGYFVKNSLRGNLSIAIVAMTSKRTTLLENGTTVYESEFNWDSTMQGYILSSFFYGFISTQFLGGYLASRIGGKRLFGTGIFLTSALNVVTPWAVTSNGYTLLVLRVIEGIFEGVTGPCMFEIISKWAPSSERTRIVSIITSGNYIGLIVTLSLSAYLNTVAGWPSIFYVFGALGIIWFVSFWFLVAESPAEDSRISPTELEYIENSLYYTKVSQKIRHPWKQMLMSLPVWAIISATISESWGYYTMLTLMPKFIKEILDYDLSQTGIMSALPYVAMTVTVPIIATLADCLLEKDILSTTQVRKIFTILGLLPQAIFMLAVALWMSPVESVVCLILAAGFSGFGRSGFYVNFLDIAPRHAGTLEGISLTLSSLTAIISPIIAGHIVVTPTVQEWQIVFYITSTLQLLGCLVYWIFATGEIQPWAKGLDKGTADETPVKE